METFELLRRTVMPIAGIALMGIGSWMLFSYTGGGSHRSNRKTPWLRLVGSPLVILGGFLLVAFSDINL